VCQEEETEGSVASCCIHDEGGPLGVVGQAKTSNHPELRRLRAGVVSVMGKRQRYLCQVRICETNASEPSIKCRELQWCRNRGLDNTPGSVGRAPGFWSDGIRHRGGVTQMQAWMRNLGTCRLDAKGATRVPTHEGLSTDARHRDGVVRSSADAAVMAAERRHGLIRLDCEGQL